MKNKIKDLFEKIKLNRNIKLVLILTVITLFFAFSTYLDILLTVILVVTILYAKKNELVYIYIYTYFFEEAFTNNIIGGIVSKIIVPFIILRALIYFIKEKPKITTTTMYIILFFAISFFIGVFTCGINLGSIVVIMNLLVILLLSSILTFDNQKDIDLLFKNILIIILFAVMNSIIFGLEHWNFLNDIRSNAVYLRFKGSYEPNFMAMFINLGIISLIELYKTYRKKRLFCILFSIMIIALLMTMSITGIIIFGLIMFLYLIFNLKKIKLKIVGIRNYKIIILISSISVVILLMASFIIIEHSQPKGLFGRIELIIENIKCGNLNSLTSGRLPIVETFIENSFDRPITNILIGIGPETKKIYVDFFSSYKFSHNTYLDIIYNFGVLGAIISSIYIYNITHKNRFLQKSFRESKYKNGLKILRISLLFTAFTLPLHAEPIVLLFFII